MELAVIIIKNNLLSSLLLLVLALTGCGGGGGGGGETTATSCSSPAVSSLSITGVVPANNATDVSVNTKITATFNACVDISTVDSSSFIITNGGAPLSGSYSFDGASYTLSFTPSSVLSYNGTYLVLVNDTVKGANGELFSGATWGFYTRNAPDVTPPVTTPSVPEGSYNTVQLVELICNDDVGGTGCETTYFTTNGSTPTTASNVYTGAINISTTTQLKFFSVDFDNNSETVNTVNYIVDTVPPTVTSYEPSTIDIPVTSTITVGFDEPILESTLTNNNFSVDNGVTGLITFNAVNNTATLTPSERLECNTLHTATLNTGVTDLAGNALASPVSWSFTTDTDCIEPITSADVQGGIYTTAQSVTLSCTDAGGSNCARMVYTTDGSIPNFSPQNGTIVTGSTSSPITISLGDSVLRYYSEDNAGNREVIRNQDYSISDSGFTFVTSTTGILRGIGQVPDSFKTKAPPRNTKSFYSDSMNGRSYRGTETGVFYSDDNAVTWHRALLEAGTKSNLVTNGLVTNGSKIYAATTKGLYVSIDGGATYQQRFPAIKSGSVTTEWLYNVYVNGASVYISSSIGLGISTDKGNTFTMLTVANGLGSNYVYDFAVDGNTIYAATKAGLSISTDGGNTFINKTTVDGLANDIVKAIVLDNGILYVGTSGGLSISSDGGATFTNRTSAADGLYSNLVKDIHIDGSNVYLATGIGVSISTNSGASFSASRPATWYSLGTDTFAITAFGSRVLVGAYPSYFETSNSGAFWEPKGLPSTSSFMREVVEAPDGTIYFSFGDSSGFDALVISYDKGETFTVRNVGEIIGSSSSIDQLYLDGNTLYIATTGIAKTSDGGNTFSVMTKTDNGLSEYSVDGVYANGSTIYAITGSGHLNKSTDSGATFSLVGTGLGNNGLRVDGSNIYIGNSSSGLNVSYDSGATFTSRTTADGLPSNSVYGNAIDAAGNVYVYTLNNGVAKSTDNATTFSTLLSDGYRVNSCGGSLFVPTGDDRLYISTDSGVTFAERTSVNGLGSSMRGGCYVP